MSSPISTSLRIFTSKLPLSSHFSKPSSFFNSSKPSNLIFSFPISFQPISTKLPPILSSPSTSSLSLQPIEELPPKLQEIVKLFQSVQDSKAKYEQLLFYGKNLTPLDARFKTRENKVEGCVSQVWVRAYLDSDENVVFEADSDSVLTKGLAALLVQGLSNNPVREVLRISPDFVVLLGLQQSLTPSRNNGFLNMLKLMQRKALELYVESEKNNSSGDKEKESAVSSSNGDFSGENSSLESSLETKTDAGDGGDANSGGLGSRGTRIRAKLMSKLSPVELEIEDVSYQHSGHAGVRGSDGETHFNLRIVSKEFEGKSLVKRHRLIYGLLDEELQSGLHALSIVAKTPDEVDGN